MKKILITLAALFIGQSAMALTYTNLLTCEEGLRIDRDDAGGFQIVLYGSAVRHFMKAGAFDGGRLNASGEFVGGLLPYGGLRKVSILHDGGLMVSGNIDRSRPDFEVLWKRYQNGIGTDFIFHRCH